MKKRVIAAAVILGIILTLSGCAAKKEAADIGAITDKIISSFEELTEIPRPTYHEKEVSDYL